MRKVVETRVRAEFHAEGDAVRVVADFVGQDGQVPESSKASRQRHGAEPSARQEARSQQSAPGRYEGKFTPAERGIHFVTLYAEGKAGAAPSPVVTIPYVAPYPKEYRELRPNLALLGRLAEETGGEMLDPEDLRGG